MTALVVDRLSESHAPAAAELMAARQRSFRSAYPEVSSAFDATACLDRLLPALADAEALGAWRGGHLVGFVVGAVSGRLGVVPAIGHAVSREEPDATDVYARLYTELARRWVDRDVLIHDVELPAVPDVEAAWNTLGFGRRVLLGTRSTTPVAGDRVLDTGVDVSVGTPEELDSIVRLSAAEVAVRGDSPMFLEGEVRLDQLRSDHQAVFDSGGIHFLARVDGEVVGLLTLLPRSRFEPICAENAPFIGTTATDPAHRGRGIGRRLVGVAAAWAQERGHPYVDVSHQSASPLIRSFWRQAGFSPIGWKVARRLPASLSDSSRLLR